MNTLSNTNLYLDNSCLGSDMLLVRVAPYYAYVDGVADKSKPEGYKYTVVLPGHNYEQLDVKIKGNQLVDVTPGSNIAVRFAGLLVRPYINRDRGTLCYTAQASGIRPAGKE